MGLSWSFKAASAGLKAGASHGSSSLENQQDERDMTGNNSRNKRLGTFAIDLSSDQYLLQFPLYLAYSKHGTQRLTHYVPGNTATKQMCMNRPAAGAHSTVNRLGPPHFQSASPAVGVIPSELVYAGRQRRFSQ